MREINQSKLPLHLGELQSKNTHLIQEQAVFNSFFLSPSTMKEVDRDSGVMRESVCWFVKKFRERNQIWVLRERRCRVTGWNANELTTNPKLAPRPIQLTLFDL